MTPERAPLHSASARPRGVALAALALAAASVACTGLPKPAVDVLEHSDHFEIFALDPYPSEEAEASPPTGTANAGAPAPAARELGGYRVLGSAVIDDPDERRRIVEIVDAGVRSGGTMAKCFNPRHGIQARRGGTSVEVVICYECSSLQITDASGTVTEDTSDVREDLDRLFAAHGVITPRQ